MSFCVADLVSLSVSPIELNRMLTNETKFMLFISSIEMFNLLAKATTSYMLIGLSSATLFVLRNFPLKDGHR